MKREKRIYRLEGKKENEEPMVFLPLCKSFRSGGFEHSIPRPSGTKRCLEEMVHMVFTDNKTDDVRSAIRRCLPDHKLNNWTATDLIVVYKESKKYPQQGHEDHEGQNHEFNFEKTTYVGEIGSEEEIDESTITPELMKLVEMEDKQILPHQEAIEVINLGSEEERKEVKIDMSLSSAIKKETINLLHEYVDIFAWSYQGMPGLSTKIVEHKLPLKP